ncbi:hypothetical protein E2C01_056844 [Portunus trituberculatus]|uniref:Uncharacterized protein n=1 Tax=Portunus trituberculatus TaxID=210409 RepID=A0A5B7GZB8_PORTR|nr:hypothetical protein [Portunus trituberculatus]
MSVSLIGELQRRWWGAVYTCARHSHSHLAGGSEGTATERCPLQASPKRVQLPQIPEKLRRNWKVMTEGGERK